LLWITDKLKCFFFSVLQGEFYTKACIFKIIDRVLHIYNLLTTHFRQKFYRVNTNIESRTKTSFQNCLEIISCYSTFKDKSPYEVNRLGLWCLKPRYSTFKDKSPYEVNRLYTDSNVQICYELQINWSVFFFQFYKGNFILRHAYLK
jgi:hypothetical protein